MRFDRAADTAAAGAGFLARGFDIDRLFQERFEPPQGIVEIAVLTAVGLGFDDDNPVLRNAGVAEIIDAAAIAFRDVKGVQITAELHG